MRKLVVFAFFLLLLWWATFSASKLMGQTVRRDPDANLSYVMTYPNPKFWDTSLTERRRLELFSVDTGNTQVSINWQTRGESGRLKSGTEIVSRKMYEGWEYPYVFIYLALKLNLLILE